MRAATHELASPGLACAYAAALLEGLGVPPECPAPLAEPHPALEWARSGAMALTGRSEGPPRLEAAGVATVARGVALALSALAAQHGVELRVDGPALLGERAALLGLTRRGGVSAGGASRLLRAADGWIAASLPRRDDLASLPAWLDVEPIGDVWRALAERAREHAAAELVERARLLGLAVAPAAEPPSEIPPWMRVAARGTRRRRNLGPPRVVDLSSLWAGPLCGRLLRAAGARVLKVESRSRPDAGREHAAFFARLNEDKQSVVLDFESAAGRTALRQLVAEADVVIESARPRALAQLGIDAEALVAEHPGLVWIAISGYGRREPGASWVAFGDDAAAAAGLAWLAGRGLGEPIFCADAVADPLTGLHAAAAALSGLARGEAVLVDLALRDVAAQAARFADAAKGARVIATADGFEVVAESARQVVSAPFVATSPSAASR